MPDIPDGTLRGRGPYGTNLGDIWLGGGLVQEKLDEADLGILIHEVMVMDGVIEEGVYVTKDPELIERATLGHELWVAEQARQN